MSNRRMTYDGWKERVLAIAADMRAGIPRYVARRHGWNVEKFSRDLIEAIVKDPSRIPTEKEYEEFFSRQLSYTQPRDVRVKPDETGPLSDDEITTAEKRPRGVSDVRWRMELRRRSNRSYYDLCDLP